MQYFVDLEVQNWWQAHYFVILEVQISWQGLCEPQNADLGAGFVNLEVHHTHSHSRSHPHSLSLALTLL